MRVKIKDYILARDVINNQKSLAYVRDTVMRFNKNYYQQWYKLCYEPLLKIKDSSMNMKNTALQPLSIDQLRQLQGYQEKIFKNLELCIDSINNTNIREEIQEGIQNKQYVLWDPDTLRYKDTVTNFSATTDDKLWAQDLYKFNYTITAYQWELQSKSLIIDINNSGQAQLVKYQEELINDLNKQLKKYKESPEGLILLTIIGGIL